MTTDDTNLDLQSLGKQCRKLFKAIECSPASVIITDRAGKIEYVNPKFTEITGYTLEEVRGRNPRLLKSGQTPPEVFEDLWQTICSGQEWHGEFINRKKNGDTYIEYAAIAPVTNEAGKITHFVAVKENITERRQAEKEKEKVHAFLQSVLDTVPDPIMVIGVDFRVKFVNRVFRDAFPKYAELAGAPFCYRISHQRDTPCGGDEHPCPLREVMSRKETVRLEHIHFNAAGEPRYIEINAAPLWGDDGALEGIIESTRDITDRKRSEEKLRLQAHYDSLTGIPNRQLFADRLDRAIAFSKRRGRGFSLLFVDLDGFKAVNDTLGHEVGDLLLKEVANRLTGLVRQSDTVARMGGDEFTLILLEADQGGGVERVVEEIRRRLAEPFLIKGQRCSVGASIGVSIYPQDGESAPALLAKADEQMYLVKQKRR